MEHEWAESTKVCVVHFIEIHEHAFKNVLFYRLMTDFVLPHSIDFVPDLVVVGTQESCSVRFEWEVSLQETLGPSHILLHSANLGMIFFRSSIHILLLNLFIFFRYTTFGNFYSKRFNMVLFCTRRG